MLSLHLRKAHTHTTRYVIAIIKARISAICFWIRAICVQKKKSLLV